MAANPESIDDVLDGRLQAAAAKFPVHFDLPVGFPESVKFDEVAAIESYISEYIRPAVSKALATSSTISMIDVPPAAGTLNPQPRWAGKLEGLEDLLAPGIAKWGESDPTVDIQNQCAPLGMRCGYTISNKSLYVVAMLEANGAPARCAYEITQRPQALLEMLYATHSLAKELAEQMLPWKSKENEELMLVKDFRGNQEYLMFREAPPDAMLGIGAATRPAVLRP